MVWKLKHESGKQISLAVVQTEPKAFCFAFFFSFGVGEQNVCFGRDSGMAMKLSKAEKRSRLLLTWIKL